MSTPELPPLNHRSRSLSGSSDVPSKQKKQGERSLLDLASRSPLSFSSSSCNSYLSTAGNSRLVRSNTQSLVDQNSTTTTSNRLGTLFEQKNHNCQSDDQTNRHETKRSKSKSISDGKTVTMVRGNSSSALTNLKNNNPGVSATRSQNTKTVGMKRIMSEPKLINDRKNFKNSHLGSKTRTKTDSPTARNGQKCVDRNGNSRVGGRTDVTRRHVSASTEFSDNVKFDIDNGDDEEDEEEERNERVLLWLEEVGHDAEIPPEPDIDYDDTPPQTDSAIHIVFGES